MRLVLGRSSHCNRKLSTLATIERNQNRDIRKAKCDFDHTLIGCCTISVVRYQLKPSRPCICATKSAVNGSRRQPWEMWGGGVDRAV